MTEILMSEEIVAIEEECDAHQIPWRKVTICDWGAQGGRFACIEIDKERVFRVPANLEDYTLFLDDERRLWLEFDL